MNEVLYLDAWHWKLLTTTTTTTTATTTTPPVNSLQDIRNQTTQISI